MNEGDLELRRTGGVTRVRRLPGARSNTVLRGRLRSDGREVVVKIARDQGRRINAEESALRALEPVGAVVPRLVGLDSVDLGEEPVPCLVQRLLPGRRPRTTAGVQRLGLDLAELARTPAEHLSLPAVRASALLRRHALAQSDLGQAVPEIGDLWDHPDRWVTGLVHGDPSPWNHLDHPRRSTWVDLETAAIGPLQLDLGRAVLTVAMSAPRRRRRSWTRSVLAGYSNGLDGRPVIGWWAVAAGQLAAWRWNHRASPGTADWREPAQCLAWLREEVLPC